MGRARIKTDESDRPGLPVTFRPGADLEQLARPFVERHKLSAAVAFKCLAALALIGLDQRHYSLVVQLAKAFVGDNPFSRACVYIQAAFAGVAAVRNGLVIVDEPHRSQLVFDVVERYLRDRDIKVDVTGLWFTPTSAPPPVPDPKHEAVPTARGAAEPSADTSTEQASSITPVRRIVQSKKQHEARAARLAKEDEESTESEG